MCWFDPPAVHCMAANRHNSLIPAHFLSCFSVCLSCPPYHHTYKRLERQDTKPSVYVATSQWFCCFLLRGGHCMVAGSAWPPQVIRWRDPLCTPPPMWGCVVTPLPLAQARSRSQKSGQNGGSTPTPCLDKAVHARDTRDSKRVGEPLDGDGDANGCEWLRMGKSTLPKAALCSISFPFCMSFKWM